MKSCLSRRSATTILLTAAITISGCAERAHDVAATYTPTARYDGLTCDQIGEEMNRVAADVNRVTGQQNDAATRDAVIMGVGLVLFWPALLILAAGDDAEELSRLKGEYEALDRARSLRGCGAPSSAGTASS